MTMDLATAICSGVERLVTAVWRRGSPQQASGTRFRLEVCPPAAEQQDAGWRFRLRHWFNAGWRPTVQEAHWSAKGADRRLTLLIAVRRDFTQALADVRTQAAYLLLERVRAAGSLRELWHLRPPIFNLIARFHTQQEAGLRLARLNRHFPTRSPRSGFGPLGAGDLDR
jgi:hypothetical protein